VTKSVAPATLETTRLLLRPIEIGDVDALWPYLSDPEISRYMSWTPHRSRQEASDFVTRLIEDRAAGRGMTWSLIYQGRLCGIFSLIAIMRRHRALVYDRAELAYWLGMEFRGLGLMKEAGRRVIAYAFEELDIHRLVVGHFTINAASERLIGALGFRYVGEERDAFMKDGIWYNMKAYDLLVTDDWRRKSDD
jgi:ribosomal-protein-alanine N-acetyltransferase